MEEELHEAERTVEGERAELESMRERGIPHYGSFKEFESRHEAAAERAAFERDEAEAAETAHYDGLLRELQKQVDYAWLCLGRLPGSGDTPADAMLNIRNFVTDDEWGWPE